MRFISTLIACAVTSAFCASAQEMNVSYVPTNQSALESINLVTATFQSDIEVADFSIYDNVSSPITFTQDATGDVVARAFYMVNPNPALSDPKVADLVFNKTIFSQSYIDKAGIEPGEEEQYKDLIFPDGNYTLKIPAGTFRVGGVLNPELTYTYTLGAVEISDIKITFDPNTFKGDAISEVTLKFSSTPETITVNPNCTEPAGIFPRYALPVPMANFTAVINGTDVKLVLEEPFTTPGTYFLFIPEGYFFINGKASADASSGNYEVNAQEIVKEISTTPLAGSSLAEFTEAKITWRGYNGVNIGSDNFDFETTKLYFEIGEDRYKAIATVDASQEDPYTTTWSFQAKNPIKGDGRLTLVLPKDEITIANAHPESDVTFVWRLKDDTEYTLVLTPAAGKVKEIGEIIVSVQPEPATFSLGDASEAYTIDLMVWDETNQFYGMLTNFTAKVNDNKTVTLTSGDTITAPGKYRVTVPASYFEINGKAVEAQNFDYEIEPASVDSIFEADTVINVTDLNGNVVLRNANRDAIKTLDKGIYIINGKKVLVK